MPVNRLPLLQLGGEDQFVAYQERWSSIYLIGNYRDVLGRKVFFPPDRCRHVCFHENRRSDDPNERSLWDQQRAECIEWIHEALTRPDEIRPDMKQRHNQAYLLEVLPAQIVLRYPRYYYVAVRPEPDQVVFLTGFPITYEYWKQARRGNEVIYRAGRR